MPEKKLPIGIQSFEEIRTGYYAYVDKTKHIWNLVSNGKVYFLSRPRRFGKSLLISTMEAYFRGKKELFKGLYIAKKEEAKGKDAWQKYPVIHFSLSDGDFQTEEGLKDKFNDVIESAISEYELKTGVRGETLPVRFKNLIEQLYHTLHRKIVVLVDEYDKPLLDTITLSTERKERNRLFYKSFFGVLKGQDVHLKFVFFTGVTKFSQVSIFSDLNQLNDISLDDRYAEICGITKAELMQNFRTEIQSTAKANSQTEEKCVSRLAKMYDGYRFSKKETGVFNPFSILNALDKKDYGSYWFSTGTPSFLIYNLEKSSFNAERFSEGVAARESDLTDYQTDNPNPIPLFYQSGYLTIYGFDSEFRTYLLRFPNDEVRYGFLNSLVPYVLGSEDAEDAFSARSMVLDIRRGDLNAFLQRMQSLFASVPYIEGRKGSYEQEWRNEIYLVLALLGQNVKCEVHSAKGRADCILETQKYVYIFEFKLDQSADVALKQIEDNGYAEPYQADSRNVYRVGVNFSSEIRNIESWKSEQLKETE